MENNYLIKWKDLGAIVRKYLSGVGTASSGSTSHVGMIIHSTTLTTEDKVKQIYGGSSWEKIEGRFLLGASSTYKINTTGGAEEVTLTLGQMPAHLHAYSGLDDPLWDTSSYAGFYFSTTAIRNGGIVELNPVGGNQPHNNMPPFKTVYIWKRTA